MSPPNAPSTAFQIGPVAVTGKLNAFGEAGPQIVHEAHGVYAPTLDGMLSLKERWGVSVGAMIMRCKSLDILDDVSAKRLWMNYARRGWRKGEPFDGKMEKEAPHLIRRCFEMLREANVQSISDIKNALPFPLEDLEELGDLDPGTLGAPVQARVEPVLKESVARTTNVITLQNRRR
jgi:hypothetical protein